MYLILSSDECARLKPETLADLLAQLGGRGNTASSMPAAARATMPGADDIDFTDVVDLTVRQVSEFLEGVHQQTADGLRVFAEHGPVIDARTLNGVGITNYGHFQGRVTKRTRTVTGNKDAFLFGWDAWQRDETNTLVSGRFAVTQTTYESLRKYFQLD